LLTGQQKLPVIAGEIEHKLAKQIKTGDRTGEIANMLRTNVLFIFSDEHDPRHMGCSGSSLLQTPNLDRLAERGTHFLNGYTSSPICVPARASLATGLPVQDIRYWDNALAYDGQVQGWGHALQKAGRRVESVGKLHFTNDRDPTGFSDQHLAMHIWEGIGMVWGSIRDPLPDAPGKIGHMLKQIGPGWSNYNQFDNDVTDNTVTWLQERVKQPDDEPWVLFTGFVAPHFPLVTPQAFFDLYPLDRIPHSKLLPADGFEHHPWIARMEEFMCQETRFAGDPDLRKLAIAGYFALCSFMDQKVGQILDALEATGQAENTLVIYTSDHGDNAGQRGLWGKSNLYRESTGVPVILAGPDVPRGEINNTPVNLTDMHATILEAAGVDDVADGLERPSTSLLGMLGAEDTSRTVMSQYHAVGSATGAFMAADARWKYHHYVGYPSELFDLEVDPEETRNLSGQPEHVDVQDRLYAELVKHLGGRTPEQIDRLAKDDQNALVERHGGRDAAQNVGTPAATPVPGKGHE
jgi:choline-sulfatase